jgi:hypothetical protein
MMVKKTDVEILMDLYICHSLMPDEYKHFS